MTKNIYMRSILLFFLLIVISIACQNEDCSDFVNDTCFSFDVRQCQTDLFADDVSEDAPESQQIIEMIEWFNVQGVNVERIALHSDFHEVVCDACDVCPTGARYFIQAILPPDFNPDSLRLLHYETGDCCEWF